MCVGVIQDSPIGRRDMEELRVRGQAQNFHRECPCVSAASYATTGYRSLGLSAPPSALTPLPLLFGAF